MLHNRIAIVAIIMIAIMTSVALSALVPPHPLSQAVPPAYQSTVLEFPAGGLSGANRTVPNQILVLRVDFPGQSFVSSPQFPDQLAHDNAFFDRWMLHLGDYFSDASRGNYQLEYTLWPEVFALSQPMAYYGEDSSERIDARLGEMLVELVAMADPEIDFSQYGGIILFHSGAGQEADIVGIRTDSIWSTFVTRKNLQASLDPENDDYPGIPTADGIDLKNIVIVPEWEFFDYFPQPPNPDYNTYLFSIYGVLAHQFGHLIGLPTLFDNDSSNGRSQGVGNWCLMGTGVWNANGYVPAQVSAWNRVYLGWETPVLVSESTESLQIDHFLNQANEHPTIYKVPISEQEYFLIENRQQNPDGSLDPYDGQPSYSFRLLSPEEQDYYLDFPLRPAFNFMENRYKGSEWDFMLPGLGGPLLPSETTLYDGSGLLIWHIDENVIGENFDPGFERNRINANAQHKGIDLEEADGIEHLDTALFDYYMYGGPKDSFRAGNNAYFGNSIHNDQLSLPTAASYYGGIPLEIFDISPSGNTMSFSVNVDWRLDTYYEGSNPFNAAMIDLDNDLNQELLYVMPSGQIYLWQNDFLVNGFPIMADSLAYHYCSDGTTVYLPVQRTNLARLRKFGSAGISTVFNRVGYEWTAQPVDTGEELLVCLNPVDSEQAELYVIEKANNAMQIATVFETKLLLNPCYFEGQYLALGRTVSGDYLLHHVDLNTMIKQFYQLPIPADSILVGLFAGKLNPQNNNYQVIIQAAHSVYAFDLSGALVSGQILNPVFSYIHDETCTAPLSIADLDRNGSLDLILAHSNGVIVLDYSGSVLGQARLSNPGNPGFSAGAMVVDLDNDGKMDIIGSFSQNRLAAWNDRFQLKQGFPVSFPSPSRNMPVIGAKIEEGNPIYYVWLASDNGKVYRKQLSSSFRPAALDSIWSSELGGLARTAVPAAKVLNNQYATTSVFVPGELYLFPNPLRSFNQQMVKLNVMTSIDTSLELKVYDISGNLVHSAAALAKAYLRNREIFDIPVDRWASGVYIAVISTATESRRLRFAIEK